MCFLNLISRTLFDYNIQKECEKAKNCKPESFVESKVRKRSGKCRLKVTDMQWRVAKKRLAASYVGSNKPAVCRCAW